MAPFCSLLLASLSMAVLGTEAQVSVEGMTWRKRFVLDVAADNPTHNFSSRSIFDCPRACSRTTGCEMFGYQPGDRRCLLYDRTVDISTGGAAAPDTRYWGRLCPVHRQYKLLSGICFKFVTTSKNWTAARDHCREEGGDLVVADSAEKIHVLNHEAPDPAWIGGTEDAGTWLWLDGTPVSQTVQPVCGPVSLQCLFLMMGVPQGCGCQASFAFFCEVPL